MNFFDTIYRPQPIPTPGPYTPKKRGGPRIYPPLFSQTTLEEIRKDFIKGRVSMKTLANRHGCHYRTISKIVHYVSPYQK